ncbi:MAG: haloacid dehalogenase [Rhodobiaceae bacterium]|nr:haloacid dehalogenase [Rhodobiaceae bacterium]|tara:strand:- start:20014 stop:20682 length:669 start_codon:yes stop_codon:yes gene_type:complete
MLHINKYDLCIFDCDGVIFDSNNLKIQAMEEVLISYFFQAGEIKNSLGYFKKNFGKSRFHHVEYFLNNFLCVETNKKNDLKHNILDDFSSKCQKLYLKANLTPDILSLLNKCVSKKFIASGSEQSELRSVLEHRKLSKYFESIFGSPTPKDEIIHNILEKESTRNAVMIGDSFSDMSAAETNKIDFIFYSPFSNVKDEMIEKCTSKKYLIINSFNELGLNYD